MFMTKDDIYMLLLVTNDDDEVVGYCPAMTENGFFAQYFYADVARPLECNIKYGNSTISTVYYTKDQYKEFIGLVETLDASNATRLEGLKVII